MTGTLLLILLSETVIDGRCIRSTCKTHQDDLSTIQPLDINHENKIRISNDSKIYEVTGKQCFDHRRHFRLYDIYEGKKQKQEQVTTTLSPNNSIDKINNHINKTNNNILTHRPNVEGKVPLP